MPQLTPNRRRSFSLIVLFWAVLQIGGLFTPGLLDDVDSVYIQIAREMLQRHDFVTPTIDGIRFFDKPPLMYWLAAASMHLFGPHDWAARIPLALGVLALLFAVYTLANYLFASSETRKLVPTIFEGRHPERSEGSPYSRTSTPPVTDRPGLYAALIMATSLGPYLYTRFYIPDILIALWMTLSVHLFLIALDRVEDRTDSQKNCHPERSEGSASSDHHPNSVISTEAKRSGETPVFRTTTSSPLPPVLAFAAVLALNLLTKGLIGIVFPLAFVLLYLALTRRLHLLPKFHLIPATLVFLAIAAPWHILAALRNPAIPMPPGLGLPTHAGWAWFYLYNEHIARFLGRRIPHDYGQTPIPIFWLYAVLWIMPWAAFLPAALRNLLTPAPSPPPNRPLYPLSSIPYPLSAGARLLQNPLILWSLIVLVFFTLSSRQEYYSLPAIPALALIVAGFLARADRNPGVDRNDIADRSDVAARQTLTAHRWLLLPLATLITLVCAFFAITAPRPAPGADLSSLLSSNPDLYNVSLGHLFDLTGAAMGLFRGPLATVALGMAVIGPVAYILRRKAHTLAANLTLAAGMALVLLAAHEGLVRFYPILGSKGLALQIDAARHPGDLVILDGELTSGSTLIFYNSAFGLRSPEPSMPPPGATLPPSGAPQNSEVLLVNGRVNGPWFGSFWPDSPHIFLDDTSLHHLWAGPNRIFLMTYDPIRRTPDLAPYAPVHTVASAGGKTILTNR